MIYVTGGPNPHTALPPPVFRKDDHVQDRHAPRLGVVVYVFATRSSGVVDDWVYRVQWTDGVHTVHDRLQLQTPDVVVMLGAIDALTEITPKDRNDLAAE